MSYFTFIPNTQYTFDGQKTTIVKNILVRAKILESLRALIGSSAEYTVADGEKPEHIAHRVYGRADYHWIILMFNEIHDPYFSWPMSTNELERHMEKTYPGKALYINTGGVIEQGTGAIRNETRGVPHDRRLPHFEVGSTIRQVDASGNQIASGKIISWDPNLWKIVVEDVVGVFRLQGNAANTSLVLNPLSLARDIRCTNSQGQEISASLLRINDMNSYSLHHFENESQEVVSPWYVLPTTSTPLIERYVVGRQEIIESAEGPYLAVTNWQHEEKKNEAKRNIRVMTPNYIDPLLRELSRVFEG